GEHYLDMVGVTGSIPVAPTIRRPGFQKLEFQFACRKVLAIDADSHPEWRGFDIRCQVCCPLEKTGANKGCECCGPTTGVRGILHDQCASEDLCSSLDSRWWSSSSWLASFSDRVSMRALSSRRCLTKSSASMSRITRVVSIGKRWLPTGSRLPTSR